MCEADINKCVFIIFCYMLRVVRTSFSRLFEESGRSIPKSDQNRKKVFEVLLPTSFCGTLKLVRRFKTLRGATGQSQPDLPRMDMAGAGLLRVAPVPFNLVRTGFSGKGIFFVVQCHSNRHVRFQFQFLKNGSNGLGTSISFRPGPSCQNFAKDRATEYRPHQNFC